MEVFGSVFSKKHADIAALFLEIHSVKNWQCIQRQASTGLYLKIFYLLRVSKGHKYCF